MLTAEIRVNGALVTHVYIQNITHEYIDYRGKEDYYKYHVHCMDDDKVVSGVVLHDPDLGCEALVGLALYSFKEKANGPV